MLVERVNVRGRGAHHEFGEMRLAMVETVRIVVPRIVAGQGCILSSGLIYANVISCWHNQFHSIHVCIYVNTNYR